MKILGEKKIFAIQYQINIPNEWVMGQVIFWINNTYVGYYDDENPLGVTLFNLKCLEKKLKEINDLNLKKIEKQKKNLFQIVYSLLNKTTYSLTEPVFDDFNFYAFKSENKLYFLWKLHKSTFFKYPNYPKKMHLASVDIDYFKSIVTEWEKVIESVRFSAKKTSQ